MPPVDRRLRSPSAPPRVEAPAATASTSRAREARTERLDRLERAPGTTRAGEVPAAGRSSSLASLRSAVLFPGGVQLTARGFEVEGFCSRTAAGLTQGSVRALEGAAPGARRAAAA